MPGAHVGGLCLSMQQEGSCFGQSGSTDPTELMLSGRLSWHGWTWDHLESLLASRWKTKSGEDIPGMVCGTTQKWKRAQLGQARERKLAGLEHRSVQGELGRGQGGAQITADWDYSNKEWA